MRVRNIDREWEIKKGIPNPFEAMLGGGERRFVNLPHDYMIESEVYPQAPSGSASGFYNAEAAQFPLVFRSRYFPFGRTDTRSEDSYRK